MELDLFLSATPNNGQFDSFDFGTSTSCYGGSSNVMIINGELKIYAHGIVCASNGGGSGGYYNGIASRNTPISTNNNILLHEKFDLSLVITDRQYFGNEAIFQTDFFRMNFSSYGWSNQESWTIGNFTVDMSLYSTFEVFVNNTNAEQSYIAPNMLVNTLGIGEYEVWKDNIKVITSTLSIQNANNLTNGFYFEGIGWGPTSVSAHIDNILIESLPLTTTPCPSTLNYQHLTDDFVSTPNPSIKKASVSITATNQITGSNTNVTYQAGNKIELNHGFKAENGSVFTAKIGGCN